MDRRPCGGPSLSDARRALGDRIPDERKHQRGARQAPGTITSVPACAQQIFAEDDRRIG